jgi:hypothetical protein
MSGGEFSALGRRAQPQTAAKGLKMSWMSTMRGAVTGLILTATVGCGGGAPGKADGGGAGSTGNAGQGGASGGVGGASIDAAVDSVPDVATDFGGGTSDVAVNCPTGTGIAAAAATLIDDFAATGVLNGRMRTGIGFAVKEQFDATANAHFDPEPGIESKCGAAAPGAAHIRGTAADTGATFALIFSGTSDAGKPTAFYDASGTKGVSLYVALGDAKATKLFTVQVNLADSKWDYTKDVIVNATTWQKVDVLWSDLAAGAAAPKFSAAGLNQIVFPLIANADVDIYIDDIAFIP